MLESYKIHQKNATNMIIQTGHIRWIDIEWQIQAFKFLPFINNQERKDIFAHLNIKTNAFQ